MDLSRTFVSQRSEVSCLLFWFHGSRLAAHDKCKIISTSSMRDPSVHDHFSLCQNPVERSHSVPKTSFLLAWPAKSLNLHKLELAQTGAINHKPSKPFAQSVAPHTAKSRFAQHSGPKVSHVISCHPRQPGSAARACHLSHDARHVGAEQEAETPCNSLQVLMRPSK